MGKRALELAARQLNVGLQISWAPFQLDGTIPPEGADKMQHYLKKFGPQAEGMLRNPKNMKLPESGMLGPRL